MTWLARGRDRTRAVHPGSPPDPSTGAIAPVINPAVNFASRYGELGLSAAATAGSAYAYSREGHPTGHMLEQRLAGIEGAEDAALFATGLAAVTAVLPQFLSAGARLVVSDSGYAGTAEIVRGNAPALRRRRRARRLGRPRGRGHGDALGGAVLGRADLVDRIRQDVGIRLGGAMSPFDAWLILRGIETYPLRLDAHVANAGALSSGLVDHPALTRVLYPGLESHPQHELALRQMASGGPMLDFSVRSPDAVGAALGAVDGPITLRPRSG